MSRVLLLSNTVLPKGPIFKECKYLYLKEELKERVGRTHQYNIQVLVGQDKPGTQTIPIQIGHIQSFVRQQDQDRRHKAIETVARIQLENLKGKGLN